VVSNAKDTIVSTFVEARSQQLRQLMVHMPRLAPPRLAQQALVVARFLHRPTPTTSVTR
jgi:hypothetical protein